MSTKFFAGIFLLAAGVLTGCSDYSKGLGDGYYRGEPPTGEGGHTEDGDGDGGGGGQGGGQTKPGTITAGEWNDLDNWDFWGNLLKRNSYCEMPAYWEFYTNNRVAVSVATEDGAPVVDKLVELKRYGTVVSAAKTNNKGRAELWFGLNRKEMEADYSTLSLAVDGRDIQVEVKPYSEGVNDIVAAAGSTANKLEVAFVVDATGSMSDELEYLKTEVVNVIGRVGDSNPQMSIMTASVFYRDVGDQYVTRVSEFTGNIQVTSDFIKAQRADGGGDYPEAVHTALEKAVGELQWSSDSRARIMFLLLDAPPHYETEILTSIKASIETAMLKGIRIIPIAASGINKETEFLLRFFAISTNGTYVFITDHSGVGNPHLEASVGQYEVEYLNDLMVRLVNEFAE